MTTLYTDLSWLYDAMYQTFINYDEEFSLYAGLMQEYGLRSVLEPIATDVATLRAFLADELRLFLKLTGLEVNEIRSQQTYAFETGVVVAGR